MEQEQSKYPRTTSRIWTGLFFIVAGVLLLAYKMNAGVPQWLVSWPMFFIALGTLIGIQHRFRNFFWIIPLFWGTVSLMDQQMPELNLHNYTLPFVIIFLGLFFIFSRQHSFHKHAFHKRAKSSREWRGKEEADIEQINNISSGEFIESNIVFGGVKKVIVSKNFKGGEINCFLGGAEIDLSQADIQGVAVIEVNEVFGGAKLIVPPHWDLKTNELNTVFGGVEDKRPVQAANVNPAKVLVLKGTSVFGGISITSY